MTANSHYNIDHPRFQSKETFQRLKNLRSNAGNIIEGKVLHIATGGHIVGFHFNRLPQTSVGRRKTVYQHGRSGGLERISMA